MNRTRVRALTDGEVAKLLAAFALARTDAERRRSTSPRVSKSDANR